VVSDVRTNISPTNLISVGFTFTFSEAVTGVDTSDFVLTAPGPDGWQSVSNVSGFRAVYTVTVNTGSGDGSLRLDLKASGTGVQDLVGNPISGGYTGR